jgi:hypothetical protein
MVKKRAEDAVVVAAVVAEYKVGRNKGRPRIWVDGRRLRDAGFTGGVKYYCAVEPALQDPPPGAEGCGAIRCTLAEPPREGTFPFDLRERRVTGRPDGKPIIDLLGRDVEASVGDARRVRVTFEPGKITIVAAKEE